MKQERERARETQRGREKKRMDERRVKIERGGGIKERNISERKW